MLLEFLSDITLIFQGKINNELINMLNLYYDKFPIIISFIGKNDSYKNILQQIINEPKFNNIELIEQQSNFIGYHDLYQNIYYQCITTYNGVKRVKTKYAIKLRSDEFFDDLTAMFTYIYNNSLFDKIICSDIFFRKSTYGKYHMSDHFFFCTTELLFNMCSKLKLILEKKDDIVHDKTYIKNIISAEQRITVSFLLTLGEDLKYTIEDSNNMINKHFRIYSSGNFKKFVFSFNNSKIISSNYYNEQIDEYNPNIKLM
jgi:hypothetical protein